MNEELSLNITPEDDTDDIVFKAPSPKAVKEPTSDAFGVNPLEDRFGRSLWERTRMCFCDPNAATDCRFHSQKEPGWEECPNTGKAKAGNVLGRWLWARNSSYGKTSTEQESSTS